VKQALRYVIGWLGLIGNLWAQSSPSPGDERIHWQQYHADSAYRAATDYLEQHLYRQAQQGYDDEATRGVLTIPVVVHVMHLPSDTLAGQGSYLSEQQVRRGLDWLNQAFGNRDDFAGGPFYSDAKDLADVVGVDTEIEFCLADQAPDGSASSGIRYHSTMLSNVDFADQVPGQTITEDQALKDLSFWDSNRYLNLWLVNSVCEREGQVCALRGYAYLPGIHGTALDGVVVEGDFWGSSIDSMAVPIYYVGRYLNLWPTSYRNVNSTPCENGNCLLAGDRVCDTPPDQERGGPACGQVANTCDSDGADPDSSRNPLAGLDVQDLYENFMDLGPGLTCANHFTAGQKRRMRETLLTARSSLLNSRGCSSLRFSAAIDSLQPLPGCEVLLTLTNTSSNRIDSLMLWYRWDGQQDTLFWQGQLPPAASVGITLSPDYLTSGQTVSLQVEVVRLNDQSARANAPFAKANLTYLCPEPGAHCPLPGQIPSMPGFYQATRVCVGADGWTHFIQSEGDGAASDSDLLLLSVRSPDGHEQDWQASRVSLWLSQEYGAGGHDLSHAPYVDNATGWHSSARYVQAWPQLKAPGLEVRLYFDELDLADLQAGLPASGLAAAEALTPWVVDESRSGNPIDGHRDVAPGAFRWYDGYQRGGVPTWALWQGEHFAAARLRCDSLGGAGLGSGGLGVGYGPRYPQALLGVAGEVEPDGHRLRWQSQREWDEVSWELWQSWEGQPFRRLRRLPGHNLGLAVDSLTDYSVSVPSDSLGPGQYAYFLVARHRSGYAQHSDTLRLEWEGTVQVQVYPNPSTGPLRVAVDVTAGTPIRFEILDGTRRQLRAYQWHKGDPVPPMNLRGMPQGLYFYHLSTDVMAVQGKLLYLPSSR